MFLTLAEFRRIRDEEALKTYRQLWTPYKQQEIDLRRKLAELEDDKKHVYSNSTRSREVIDEEMRPFQKDLQYVTAKLTAMEKDALVRKERLGLNAWAAFKPDPTESEETNAIHQ